MISRMIGQYRLEMKSEHAYTFGSQDNGVTYECEHCLSDRQSASVIRGFTLFLGETQVHSAVVGASGGAAGVHEDSLVCTDSACFAAVGSELVCLSIPDLSLQWHRQADTVSCFAVYLLSNSDLLAHGECEISRFTSEGTPLWSFSGHDIFTGAFALSEHYVDVVDFEGTRYRIDLATGSGHERHAKSG
jgi:hypothetical protein